MILGRQPDAGRLEAHIGSRRFLRCNISLDCSRSSAARPLISRKLLHTSMPIGFFVTGISLEIVASAIVMVRLLRDRFHRIAHQDVHQRRGQDVPVKEAWMVQYFYAAEKSNRFY